MNLVCNYGIRSLLTGARVLSPSYYNYFVISPPSHPKSQYSPPNLHIFQYYITCRKLNIMKVIM